MTEKLDFNMNYEAIIYPNEKGWNRIISDLMEAYQFNVEKATEWAEKRKTEDGGYKEQLWEIIAMHNGMFFNGTSYFETTNMVLLKEIY